MLTRYNIIIYGLALTLALGSWWWLQRTAPQKIAALLPNSQSSDYYSAGYQKQEMDEHGLVKTEVKAAKMIHHSTDDSIQLEGLELRLHHHPDPPWVIVAEHGILKDKGKTLWLTGQVSISRAPSQSGGRSLSIKTSDLHVQPKNDYAETTQWAELSSPPNITTGRGLQLHYGTPIHIKLLNQVRGRYENH